MSGAGDRLDLAGAALLLDRIMAHAVTPNSPLDDLLEGVVAGLSRLVGSTCGCAFWSLKASLTDPIVRLGDLHRDSKTIAREAAQRVQKTGSTLWVTDGRMLLGGEGGASDVARGMLAVPLRLTVEDAPRILGALTFERPQTTPSDELIAFIEAVGEKLAMAVWFSARQKKRRAQFEDLLEQVDRMTTLLHLDRNAQRDAVIDPATGLVNRAFFENHCPIAVATAHRYKHPLSVIILNVVWADDRKLGPAEERAVLTTISREVLRLCRSCDTVAQFGDQTVILMLPHTNREGCATLAGRIRESVAKLKLPAEGLQAIPSLGTAVLLTGDDAKDLLVAAQLAVDRAKTNGGNRVIAAPGR
jgi:diguanylate cyclase (GGDEF)-like protein